MNIKVDTAKVATSANSIKKMNEQINKDFQEVEKSINSLGSNWEGTAYSKAIKSFGNIKNILNKDRHTILNNYVNFLLQSVGKGYDDTENAIVSAASKFK